MSIERSAGKPRSVSSCVLALAVSAVLLICCGSAYSAIQLIYPDKNSKVNSQGHLIFKINDLEATAVRVTINGSDTGMVDVSTPEYRKHFQDFFIAQSIWDSGVNDIAIDVFRGGQKTESLESRIFFAPKLGIIQAPPEYKVNLMHLKEKEGLCNNCHVMNPTPAMMNKTTDKDNPCVRCHKRMFTYKYVHGPAATYSCGYCHSSRGKPKHVVPRKGADLCYECHVDMAADIAKKAFVHGPVEARMCELCHDSHGSPNEAQLLAPINELCLSCHGHIGKGIHVMRLLDGKGHPLKGKADLSKPSMGKEMSCVSCHNPHGGQYRYYFANNAEERGLLCKMCHTTMI